MKTSKKLLSILLVAVMMLSFVTVAFAAENTAVTEESRIITLKPRKESKIEFSPEQPGIYRISTEFITKGASDLTVSTEKTSYIFESFVYHGDDFSSGSSVLVYAAENDTITIDYYPSTAYFNRTISAEYSISFEGNNILTEGKAAASPENNLFVFIPEETGYYNFRSDASEGSNPYIMAFNDKNWFSLGESNEDDFNFDLTDYFEAGKYYIIEALSYNQEYDPYEFTVSRTDIPKITDISFFDYYDGDTIVLDNPSYLNLPVIITPYYAGPTADIKVSVGNSSIISAKYIEEFNDIEIITHKTGTTTLTITAADGCRCEYTVIVQNRFVSMLMSLFERIADIFSSIFNFLNLNL